MKVKKLVLTFIIAFTALFSLHANERKPVLSVLYFQNNTGSKEYSWISKGIADMLISDLSKSKQISVVERQNIEKLIKEKEFADLGLVEKNSLKDAALFLQADYLITGSYYIDKKFLRIDVRITKIDTSELKAFSVKMPVKNYSDLEKKTAKTILDTLGYEIPFSLQVDTESYLAAKEFYEGIILLDRGKYSDAITKFEKAEKYDPLYSKPSEEKAKAYQFLNDFRKARYHREMSKFYDKANKIIKRMNEDPFLTYSELLNKVNWAEMTPEERKNFNNENLVYIQYSSKSQCALVLQSTLLEIVNYRNNFIDDTYDRLEKMIDVKIDKLRKQRREEIQKLTEIDKRNRNKYYESREKAKKIEDKDNRSFELKKLSKDYNADRKNNLKMKQQVSNKYKANEQEYRIALDNLKQERKAKYMEAASKNNLLYDKILNIAAASEREYNSDDKFLPPIMYYRLLVYLYKKDYKKLKYYSEKFLKEYPDYRMIESVENFYERSLEKLN